MSATEIQESLESSTEDVQDTGVKLRRVPAVAQNIHASVKVIISTTCTLYTKCYKKVAISINSVKIVSEAHMRNISFHHACSSVNLSMKKRHTCKGCTATMASRVITEICQSLFECRCVCMHGTLKRNFYWSNGGRQRPKSCLGHMSQT